MIHIFNPGTSPVVYSKQGHIIGGGEHMLVESLDSHGQKAVRRGYIVILPNAEEETSQEEESAGESSLASASASKTGSRKRPASTKNESGEDSGASEGSGGN